MALARRTGRASYTLSPGEQGEGQFGSVPVPADGRITYPAPDWILNLEHGSILLVDDIACLQRHLQPFLLGIFLRRTVGDTYLGHGVRIFAAGNPASMVGGGDDLGLAQGNRTGHLIVDYPTGDEWADFLLSDGGDADAPPDINVEVEEARVEGIFPNAYAKMRGLWGAYARRRGSVFKVPDADDPAASRAWFSPRSGEMAIRAHASSLVHSLDESTTDTFIGGFVGLGAVEEIRAFERECNLPDPSDLLDGKVTWRPDSRIDVTCAVVESCATLVLDSHCTSREDRIRSCYRILDSVASVAPDAVVPAAKALGKAGLHRLADAESKILHRRILPALQGADIFER